MIPFVHPNSILWAAKASAIHRTISCSYVGDTKELLAIYEDHVKCFDLATNQWEWVCALRKHINVDYYTSVTFLSANRVFLCGGGEKPCTLHVDNLTYLLEGNGAVQELPHLRTGRTCTRLTSDAARKAIYVFGGHNGPRICYTGLQSCEQFHANQWSPLPDMHKARSFFNPCWHRSLIYLCGGWTDSVETYNRQFSTFTLLGLTLPQAESSSAVVDGCTIEAQGAKYEELPRSTVLTFSSISKLQQGRFISQKRPE